jgi:hypothetical protein
MSEALNQKPAERNWLAELRLAVAAGDRETIGSLVASIAAVAPELNDAAVEIVGGLDEKLADWARGFFADRKVKTAPKVEAKPKPKPKLEGSNIIRRMLNPHKKLKRLLGEFLKRSNFMKVISKKKSNRSPSEKSNKNSKDLPTFGAVIQ